MASRYYYQAVTAGAGIVVFTIYFRWADKYFREQRLSALQDQVS
jgi:hypothetical protein